MTIQEKIQFITAHPELTLREMAKALGVSLSNVWFISRDHNLPYKRTFRQGGRQRTVTAPKGVPKNCFDYNKNIY